VIPEAGRGRGASQQSSRRPGVSPEALITLANLGLPRRPGGARTRVTEAALPDAATASRQLGKLIAGPVTEAELPGLRDLQRAAAQAVDALLAGKAPDCAAVNVAASGSTGRVQLVVSGGQLRERIVWDDGTAAAGLARQLVGELAALDPSRLRRCARRECDLVFYDTTRSRTRRWHAEDPCGWRERQHARRHPTPVTPSVPPNPAAPPPPVTLVAPSLPTPVAQPPPANPVAPPPTANPR
jgi:predicted RNA-binding Zn ribbon-like protein